MSVLDAYFSCCFFFHADVDGGVGAGACLNDDEMGLETRVLGAFGGDGFSDLVADGSVCMIRIDVAL